LNTGARVSSPGRRLQPGSQLPLVSARPAFTISAVAHHRPFRR